MNISKWLGATFVVAFSWAAQAAGGLTVINTDSVEYVLIVEDAQEKSWEVNLAPGATVANICTDCYVALKGQEDFEYGDVSTVIRIIEGRLVVEGQE